MMFNRQFNNRKRFERNPRRSMGSFSYTDLIRVVDEAKRVKPANVTNVDYKISNKFQDFDIAFQLKKNIQSKGFETLTPIQDKTIPFILGGRDIIGIANTGTGKTAAFLIPLINKVFQNRSEKVLILTPTRELAFQIDEELFHLSKNMGVKKALCIGGMPIYRQKKELSFNPHFVIGTPGRIKDLINQKILNLSQFNSVVLDEVDRMVDIGFIREVKFLVSLLPKNRQSLFFSATLSGKISEILGQFVSNPVTISVKKNDTSENIKQEIVAINKQISKVETLHNLLIQKDFQKVLIFGRTKHGVQKLSDELVKRGFKANAIHGNKRQSQRQSTISKFKGNEITILLATDVASRGLDINGVSHVINYDMPESYEDYIHRIGRTGRGDKKGIALTFMEVK